MAACFADGYLPDLISCWTAWQVVLRNWRTIIAECEHLIGKSFKDKDGNNYHFFGVVHGEDDYYYGMSSKYTKSIHLLSCVGSLETSGFELIEEQ